MTWALFLADFVVAVHLAYLIFVLLGGFLGLRDVRWIGPHLLVCLWGVVGTWSAAICPLTVLEKWFIRLGGAIPYDGPFISHYLTGQLYPADAQAEVWLTTALVVLTSYVVVGYHLHTHRPHGGRHTHRAHGDRHRHLAHV